MVGLVAINVPILFSGARVNATPFWLESFGFSDLASPAPVAFANLVAAACLPLSALVTGQEPP
jgi:hypothetical protein